MSRSVIILGMHRSGTSCLTGSLQEAGLQLGEVNQKTRCNEKGTRENVSIMELNDAVLASAGAAWDNPPVEKIVWRADHKIQRKHAIEAAEQEPVWGFKDPRTLLTIDGWREALPGARLIATFRDPYAVAQSLNVRNGFPIERGLALWRAYNERLLAVCDEDDVAVINFDWSSGRYRHGLEALCAEIGLQAPANGFQFFETRLRRNESALHLDLPPPLRATHRRLQTAARMTMRRIAGCCGQAKFSPPKKDEKAEGDRPRPVRGAKPASAQADKHTPTGECGAGDGSLASRRAALEAAIRKDGARPGLLDQLGDLLAQENRWSEADGAYRRALRVRCETFGFRHESGGTPASANPTPVDPVAARARLDALCNMLARFGAQYWAEDLVGLLSTGLAPTEAIPWPQGRALPEYKHAPIAPRSDNRQRKILSVMFPVYEIERDDWFREALDGVLDQNLDSDLSEIVIVDDASKNGTAQRIAESYGARVRYVRNKTNLGLVGNHNRSITEATGDFVHILHQDDRVLPGFYDALLPALQNDCDLVAGMTHAGYIDSEGRLMSEEKGLQQRGVLERWEIKLSLQVRIQFPTIIVRRDAYQAAGGFSPSLKFSFDWDMWNRIAASGPVWFEPRPLAQYRVHQGSATYQFGWRERVEDAMQTVAHMVQRLPRAQRRAIAEMAIHKFFRRYWMLLSVVSSEAVNDDQQALIDFLLSGWTTPDETAQLKSLFSSLKKLSA